LGRLKSTRGHQRSDAVHLQRQPPRVAERSHRGVGAAAAGGDWIWGLGKALFGLQ